MLSAELINSTFGTEIFCGDGYFSVIFSGESSDPEKVRDEIAAELKRFCEEGIPEEDFQRCKKSAYGTLVRELNNVEAVANLMINAAMSDAGPFDTMDVLAETTALECVELIRSELVPEHLVMSVVEGAE